MASPLAPAGAAIVSAVLNYPLTSCATVVALWAAHRFGGPVLSCCHRPTRPSPLDAPRVTRTPTPTPAAPTTAVVATPTPPPVAADRTMPIIRAETAPAEQDEDARQFEELQRLDPTRADDLERFSDLVSAFVARVYNPTEDEWHQIDHRVWELDLRPDLPNYGETHRLDKGLTHFIEIVNDIYYLRKGIR